MKETYKVAVVFIGTIVGAGLASGQEIMQFFSTYGLNGFFGILICCSLYIMMSYVIVSLCFTHKFRSYRNIIEFAFGKNFSPIADAILTFFIFSGNVIMLSGGGAMAKEYLGINRLWGILIMALLTFCTTYFSNKGIIAINSVIVPISTLFILIIGFLVVTHAAGSGQFQLNTVGIPEKERLEWLSSSILYAAFNLMAATGVLCPLAVSFKSKRSFVLGCTIGGVVLTLLAISINYSVLFHSPQSFHFEIPNLYIAREYGFILPLFLTIIIWLEMFSTEVANLYSLSSALQCTIRISNTKAILMILGASIPFTLVGFSKLIHFLYPAYGVLGLLFLIACLLRFCKSFFSKL